ncbi:MAG: hypothetical protein RL088_3669 [Verrucomicrobiota bacterium]|jgi:hypothetical protein
MWIRRTPDEVFEVERRHDLSRFNPIAPAAMAVALSLFFSIARWIGWRGKFAPSGDPIPMEEAFSGFPASCIVIFLIIYAYRVFFRDNPPCDGALICTTCFEAAGRYAPTKCGCGGSREPQYMWRWEEGRRLSSRSPRND